ncbi:MAG: S8 family serine peptidase [Elusimicrobia bacterium]|nr:S8 family serine peptidase [Elusimicrobiota bacterium]
MKRSLSIVIAASMLVLSWGPAAPVALAAAAAVQVKVQAPTSPLTVLPTIHSGLTSLSAPALGGSLISPVLSSQLPAAPKLAPAAPLVAAPVAAPAAMPAVMTEKITQDQDGSPTPFALSLQALAAPAPGYQDMAAGETRGAADDDFQQRIGRSGEVELLVSAPEGSGKVMTEDVYPLGLSQPGLSVKDIDSAMGKQLKNLGVSPDLLAAHDARAIGAVSQINTAVLKVAAGSADTLKAALEAQGLQVQFGRVFHVPQPQQAEPSARTVGLSEMAKIIGADKLQSELRKVLGDPIGPGGKKKGSLVARAAAFAGKALRAALGKAVENPVLPWAVLDSWVSVDHPFLKGHFLKSVTNDDDGESHGTHTAGTVVGMDRWNTHGRNYNIFPNGSASESDILFKLNMAQTDGALGTTNSWGDTSGDPEGAIEKLFVKQAQAGMHHSISAGNSGSRKNTIGGPAIAVADADMVVNGKVVGRVKRIKAIAASDADKKTAYFSSRGPGSRTTAGNPEQYKDYPQKPDESAVGVNLVAPIPKGSNVPELGGPGGSMSGTSMSNPGAFGAFLLLTRSILVLLKDKLPVVPTAQQTQFAMDLARFAMTRTAEKVAGPDEVGDGFINVWSAFEYAGKLLQDNAPASRPARDLSLKEFGILNGLGVAASLAAGILGHAVLLGILGMYVAPIPVLFAYVGIKRLLGDRVNWPSIRFSPSISFAGKQYPARRAPAPAGRMGFISPEAAAALALSERDFVTALRLLSGKNLRGAELMGQTGLSSEGLQAVLQRLDDMDMVFINGSLRPGEIAFAYIAIKPSAQGAALLIARPWPGTDRLSRTALDALGLLKQRLRFGYDLMASLGLDQAGLEAFLDELQTADLVRVVGEPRGPNAASATVYIQPSGQGKVNAVLERVRLLKLLLRP